MFFVLLTACSTTGYTVCDSLSQSVLKRAVGGMEIPWAVQSVTYHSTREMMLSLILILITILVPGQRKNLSEMWKTCKWAPFAAGLFASLTYVLVLIAMNYVTNVSYVQVFRQVGLIIGLLAGMFILKEKGALPKYIGVLLIVGGLVLSVFK